MHPQKALHSRRIGETMYILLLATRYLRTRFIAMASIVSVTLGVATLIVVNSVMSGFSTEMQNRLHGILSDVEVGSPGLGEIYDPNWHLEEIRNCLGDDLEQATAVVRVPALLHYEFRGRPMTQQVLLIGIDDKTFSQVSDFQPYLTNANLRNELTFELQNDGYDPEIGKAGWDYRREIPAVVYEHERITYMANQAKQWQEKLPQQVIDQGAINLTLPVLPPLEQHQSREVPDGNTNQNVAPKRSPAELPMANSISGVDPYTQVLPPVSKEQIFDPYEHQHIGIVLGRAIAHRKFTDPANGESTDIYLLRPGDDVQLTLPTAGNMPRPISEKCTIVDFYFSKMHEYDSNFAFMPLSKLQSIRGMIDPQSGMSTVSAIQLKLKAGADLNAVRNKLSDRFPANVFPYVIQTWQDAQRPLLSAVHLETMILNILLFLIIAVAGFGILATFFMIVVEKTKDIGILKALGAPKHGVMSIFLGYGLSLGIVGTGVGICAGLLFVHYINNIADLISWCSGHEVFDPTIYYFAEIPTLTNWTMVVWVAVGAIGIAVLASVLPALRASRMHPVESLRYE
jgi:lipoprotein-releasing system permease protein